MGSYEFARATGKVGYVHDDYSNSPSGNNEIDLSGVIAKYVRLTATSTWGGGELYGLSEVRFFYIPLWIDVWIDGFGDPANGSRVGHLDSPYAEQEIVHGGEQSMPFYYDNSSANYSEATASVADLDPEVNDGDWTKSDVKVLTLWFYGDPDNDISEPMWVKLTDQGDDSGMVTYGSYTDEDVNNLADPSWHGWNIELAEFGIDLNDVNSIAIGFGNKDATTQGGLGIVYFDDIRLYPPRCVPSRAKPAADFTNDCTVNHLDLKVMAQEWLSSELPLQADLYKEEDTLDIVNFKDFAKFADMWLEEKLWPEP